MAAMRYGESSDEQCATAARDGDRDAFSELVRRHQHALYRFVLRMLQSPDEALETAQDAFVRAWQALPGWQPDAAFRTWLFRIASNASLDVLRRRRLVDFVPLDDECGTGVGALADVRSADPGPERRLEVKQEMGMLEGLLARLSAEHREILLLREIEDMSYADIGQVLTIGQGTVKSRLARARAALLQELAKEEP